MAKCDCYYQHGLKFLCYGTKEMEECSCGGDESKCNFYPEKRAQATQKLKTMPTVEVVHARWDEWYPPMHMIMTGEEMLYRCSACDAKYSDVEGYRYCPFCGSLMDGGKSDAKRNYPRSHETAHADCPGSVGDPGGYLPGMGLVRCEKEEPGWQLKND